MLISPYTSLREAVKSVVGSLAALLVRERFDNLSLMGQVRCPTLIIHGQKDQLLEERHALDLHAACGAPSKLVMPATMTHNDCDLLKDIVYPMQTFLLESNLNLTIADSLTATTPHQNSFLPP